MTNTYWNSKVKTKIVMAAFIDTWTFVYFVAMEKKAISAQGVIRLDFSNFEISTERYLRCMLAF